MANNYLNWLVRKVCNKEQAKRYSRLFELLNDIEFIWVVDLDQNRVAHAIDMRCKYEIEHHLDKDYKPASVLEVLVCMAIRCEDCVMGDSDHDNRTDIWFWEMISNCGLNYYSNENYDEDAIIEIVNVFMYREYRRDGSNGGLFYIPGTNKDLRKYDIWMQMMWYLSRLEEENGKQ